MSPAALLGGPASSATLPPASLTVSGASSGVVAPLTLAAVNAVSLSTIASIDDPIACRWSTLLNRVGVFELTVPYDSTAGSALIFGNAVTISIGGVVAASYLIEERVDLDVEMGEEAAQNIVVRGRVLDAFLDRGSVLPTLGVDSKPWAQSRTLSFAAPEFTIPGAWNAPTLILAGAANEFAPTGFWSLFEDFVGPAASSSPGGVNTAPTGFWYVIYDFSVAVSGSYVFGLSADNSAKVYIDGFLLADMNPQNDPLAFIKMTSAPIYLTAGTHRFAARIINLFKSGAYPGYGTGTTESGNPTHLLMTCWRTDGSVLLSRVFGTRNYPSFRHVEYPASAPGMTFAQSFTVLLNAAKAAGLDVTAVTLDTSAADPTTLESVTFQVGDTLLKVLADAVQSGYCDYRYGRNAHTLKLFTFGTLGVSSGITYSTAATPDTSTLQKLERDQIDVGTDVLLVEYTDGQVFVPSSGGTRLGFLKLGDATREEGQAIAKQVLADQAQPAQVTVKVQPTGNGDYPWIDLDVGDTAGFNPGTGSVTRRVYELHGSLTDDGIEFEMVVQSVHLADSERIALLVQRRNGGTLGGTSPSSPAGPSPKISRYSGGSEVVFQLADGATIPIESPDKTLQGSANCYGVKVTAKTTLGTVDTTFKFVVDGVDRIGSFGVLPSGSLSVICPFDSLGNLLIYCTAGVTRLAFNVTAVGHTGLLFEPQFAAI